MAPAANAARVNRRAGARAYATTIAGVLLTLLAGCVDSRPPDFAPSTGAVQLGPRPFYLLDLLEDGPLRERLETCRDGPFRPSQFSIGHRGAPLQFPEHTRASYRAAAVLGAGQLECDVTFTKDRVLVCRHAQCDLATTTNILSTPLADRCRVPFEPATSETPAHASCCTHDYTFDELRTLEARMDAANPQAARPEEFASSTPATRTDLYVTGHRILSHAESLVLALALGNDVTPELKAPEAAMPFEGDYALTDFADQLVDEVRDVGVPPSRVRLQSFDPAVIRHWIRTAPNYGAQAVWLVGGLPESGDFDEASLAALYDEGFRTLAPPTSLLLALDGEGRLVASDFAERAKAAGFELVAWTLERSGRIRNGRVDGRPRDFYLDPVLPALANDGDVYRVIHALHAEVGVRAIFSDWPAAVTYYANCMGLD